MRPRRGGLLRIYSALALRRLVSCPIGAGRRPEEGAPRPEEAKPTEPPACGGYGGRWDGGSAGGGVRVREPPPTRWKPERETEEGGGICAAAPRGRHGHNNRTRPIMRAL